MPFIPGEYKIHEDRREQKESIEITREAIEGRIACYKELQAKWSRGEPQRLYYMGKIDFLEGVLELFKEI